MTKDIDDEIKYLLIEICHFRVSIRVTFDIILNNIVTSGISFYFYYFCLRTLNFVIYHRLFVFVGVYYVSDIVLDSFFYLVTNLLNYIFFLLLWENSKIYQLIFDAWSCHEGICQNICLAYHFKRCQFFLCVFHKSTQIMSISCQCRCLPTKYGKSIKIDWIN